MKRFQFGLNWNQIELNMNSVELKFNSMHLNSIKELKFKFNSIQVELYKFIQYFHSNGT
jgi:hypothetical protein